MTTYSSTSAATARACRTPGSAGGVDDALVMHDVGARAIKGQASLKNVLLGRELGAALARDPQP